MTRDIQCVCLTHVNNRTPRLVLKYNNRHRALLYGMGCTLTRDFVMKNELMRALYLWRADSQDYRRYHEDRHRQVRNSLLGNSCGRLEYD